MREVLREYKRMGYSEYLDFILGEDVEIVREIQADCAAIAERGEGSSGHWTQEDAERIAAMFNRSKHPTRLFRFVDEKPGNSTYVGYRTRDGREWFHILRQMRNQKGSGLLENLNGGWV